MQHLLFLRALTGISIGGAIPVLYSLVGDLFPKEQRANAAAALGVAQGVGIILGQSIAGFIGPKLGWRCPSMY